MFQDAFSGPLPSVLEEFINRHSDVQFEFLPSDERHVIGAGKADLGIRAAQRIDDPTLNCRKIRDRGHTPFASMGYAAKRLLSG